MTMQYAEDGTTIILDDVTFVPDFDNAPSEIKARIAAAGGLAAVLPYEPPPPLIPNLTPRQLCLMLLQIGMTSAMVDAAIASIPDPVAREVATVEWTKSTTYERHHPLVDQLAAGFGFTDSELDTIWTYAASI